MKSDYKHECNNICSTCEYKISEDLVKTIKLSQNIIDFNNLSHCEYGLTVYKNAKNNNKCDYYYPNETEIENNKVKVLIK